MALPKTYGSSRGFGAVSTHRRPRGRDRRDRPVLPAIRSSCPTGEMRQRPPAYSAVKVGGERAYRRRGAARRSRCPSGRSPCTASSCSGATATAPSFEIECSSGTYVRSLIADLGDAYCAELRRTAIGPFRVADADAGPDRARWPTRSAFLPERRLGRRRRPPRGRTAWPCRARRAPEPTAAHGRRRPDRARRAAGRTELKPVVGFRGAMKVTRLPDAAAAPAPRRRRRVRRRAPRPPRGDRRAATPC